MLRTKRAFEAKGNAIFKEISIAKNCLRSESAPLTKTQKHDRIARSCSLSQCCRRSTSPTHVALSSRSIFRFNLILFMGLVKVCCRQYFLHQNFYKTPKTKRYIYEQRKLMYNHQNVAFHLFSPSAATLENMLKIQLFQNYGVTYVLMT